VKRQNVYFKDYKHTNISNIVAKSNSNDKKMCKRGNLENFCCDGVVHDSQVPTTSGVNNKNKSTVPLSISNNILDSSVEYGCDSGSVDSYNSNVRNELDDLWESFDTCDEKIRNKYRARNTGSDNNRNEKLCIGKNIRARITIKKVDESNDTVLRKNNNKNICKDGKKKSQLCRKSVRFCDGNSSESEGEVPGRPTMKRKESATVADIDYPVPSTLDCVHNVFGRFLYNL
jgi:hypothetical protein